MRRLRALVRWADKPAVSLAVLYLGFATLFFGSALMRGVARGRLIAGDGLFYYAYLPSLVVDRDLDFRNDFESLRGPGGAPLKSSPTSTGKMSSPFAFGTPLLDLPFFLVGHSLDTLVNARGDGYGWLAQSSVCIAGLVYSFLGSLLLARMLRRWFPPETALGSTLAAILASSLVYYTLVSPTYSHAASFFAVTLFLTVWLECRARLTFVAATAVGAAGGLMALVRWQDVVLAAVPATEILVGALRPKATGAERRRCLAFAAVAVLMAALVFSPQLWIWKSIYGTALTVPQGETWVRWGRPDIAAALFSLGAGGLFTWTPITFFGVLGLIRFREREPLLAAGLLIAFALEIYVEGTVHHGLGSAYGSRRLIGCTTLFTIGFATLVTELTHARRAVAAWVLAATLVAWNALLLAQYQWTVHARGRTGPYPTLTELVTHLPFRR